VLRPGSRFLFAVTAAALFAGAVPTLCAEAADAPVPIDREVHLTGGADATLHVYPAEGHRRVLWLLNDHGRHAGVDGLARDLAGAGVEVWVVDLMTANFLAQVKSSVMEVPPEQVVDLIKLAAGDGRDVYGFAAGRGAVLAASGAAALSGADGAALRGLVLIAPNLYVETPEPGTEAEYLPVVAHVALPVFIIQPELSPWRWWLDRLSDRLRAGGSSVRYVILPGVRGRFEFRPDGTERENEAARRLPGMILDAMTFLDAPKKAAR
jgi:hypothetical protein